ncbi:MAG: hypothetical protein REJ23_13715 [Brevundimonas sp.]|nr:hypothetical protein [Brevundimonas sp.]
MKASVNAGMLLVAAAILAGPSNAQETEDGWDLAADPATNSISASISYASGASIIVQCRAGTLLAGISGTPLSRGPSRRALFTRGDVFSTASQWEASADGRLALNNAPITARFLRLGGPVTLQSVEGDSAPFSVAFDLPASGAAVDRVLTACDQPVTRDHDRATDVSALLEEGFAVEMPTAALPRTGGVQTVALSCIIADGRLSECVSERQQPPNPQGGELTARRANGVRVRLSNAAAAEGGRVEIVVTGARIRR